MCACVSGFSGGQCQNPPADLCAGVKCGSGTCVEDYVTSQGQCLCRHGYTSGSSGWIPSNVGLLLVHWSYWIDVTSKGHVVVTGYFFPQCRITGHV